jgi:hypothetical protein
MYVLLYSWIVLTELLVVETSRDYSLGKTKGYRLDGWGSILDRTRVFFTLYRLALQGIQRPIQSVLCDLSRG